MTLTFGPNDFLNYVKFWLSEIFMALPVEILILDWMKIEILTIVMWLYAYFHVEAYVEILTSIDFFI